jgi:superfamily II DNA or RNA helicase
MAVELPEKGAQVRVDGALVTVRDADHAGDGIIELFVVDAAGAPQRILLTGDQLAKSLVPLNDRGGDPQRALTGLWGRWMQHAVPRIRSAVLATRPLKPFAHQDEAVHGFMLNQPRLRFLLGDEPGTGKTIMAGMYLTEGRRIGLIQGRTAIVVPAHLVTKWERDLLRLFGVQAKRITTAVAVDPADLDPRFDTWIVSLDLYTHNAEVRRKVAGSRSSWSLVIFDEAHRLTPTSQFLSAARQLAECSHHLLLMTATPHRGKEHYFRGLMNLLDPTLYPWDPRTSDYDTGLVPSKLSFLRRMKEDLIDHDGTKLFKPRFSETIPVTLNKHESAAYDAVMSYVETFYSDTATLARSIYGKRAASSLFAASATLLRRQASLKEARHQRSQPVLPEDLITPEGLGIAADDDEAWTKAENALVTARTKNKTLELARIESLLHTLSEAQSSETSAKWINLTRLMERHQIAADGKGQLLVFSEFADTARWLKTRFEESGYSTEILDGSINHTERDALQERFLAGDFQVLISTDAGGEGIDLQSANVMVDWDLPWSMVRLEQRMGRLHRIGQKNPVHVYHLVAPHTREGRVQQVMLTNLENASRSLKGKIYDLLDATAERAGFDWGKAMVDAQAGREVTIPDANTLIASAQALVAEERTLASPANVTEALERFAADRLEAINPIIVEAMVEQVARSEGWTVGPGPAKGIRSVEATQAPLPGALGGSWHAHIAAAGVSVRQAINDGATGLDDVIVLGPTEEPFQELIKHALATGEGDLVRGTTLIDQGSLTSYVLTLFDADIQVHDGRMRTIQKSPLLIRCSLGQSVPVAWDSLMKLRAPNRNDPASSGPHSLPPGIRHDAHNAARSTLRQQVLLLKNERQSWIEAARSQLDATQYRFEESIADRPLEERRVLLDQFAASKAARERVLEDIAGVTASAVRLVGWVSVTGGARLETLGYDPDAEKVAIATVVSELERHGFDVDDRQSAGLGYDLYARHRSTREQRLVEVKGQQGSLRSIWLEQNEWAQAQQRSDTYWLYVVTSCATQPTVVLRQQDPADALRGPRRVERFQIPLSELTRLIGAQK